VGRELNSREGERERDGVLLQKGYGVSNKLDHWRKYLWQLEKDNPRSYQDEHLDYLREFRWFYFYPGAVLFYPAVKLPIYTTSHTPANLHWESVKKKKSIVTLTPPYKKPLHYWHSCNILAMYFSALVKYLHVMLAFRRSL
jgi:hypothetical protein